MDKPKQTPGTVTQTSIVGPQTLACLLGISEIRVHNLIVKGILKQLPGGKLELASAISSYIQHIRLTKHIPPEGSAQEREAEEKAIRARIARERDEIRLQKERREVHLTEDVRRVFGDIMGMFKVRLWSMPQLVAQKLSDQFNIDQDAAEELLRGEMQNICELLTGYRKEDFYLRNNDYFSDGDNDEDVIGTSGTDENQFAIHSQG